MSADKNRQSAHGCGLQDGMWGASPGSQPGLSSQAHEAAHSLLIASAPRSPATHESIAGNRLPDYDQLTILLANLMQWTVFGVQNQCWVQLDSEERFPSSRILSKLELVVMPGPC